MIIRHICVEGWDYIGQWSGVNLRQFLERVGADLTAKYVAFRCADDYTESLDMPTALHPQTMLATKYAREPITDPFGFPLRLRTATKLGFKNAKWVTAIEVTNDFQETFWSKQGLQLVRRNLTARLDGPVDFPAIRFELNKPEQRTGGEWIVSPGAVRGGDDNHATPVSGGKRAHVFGRPMAAEDPDELRIDCFAPRVRQWNVGEGEFASGKTRAAVC